MTVWIKRSYDNEKENYRDVLDEFGRLWIALLAPREMMLVAQGVWGNTTTLYISVPEEKHIASFRGFEPMDAKLLPKEASLFHGRKDAFDEQFDQATK